MDMTNQTGHIDEELQLLKTEIKQVLHNVQENVFNAQDPFGDLPSANATQEFASLAESQGADAHADFVAGVGGGNGQAIPDFSPATEGQPPSSGTAERDGGIAQASPAELSDFLASDGNQVAAPAGPVGPGPAQEPDPGPGSTEAAGDLNETSQSQDSPYRDMNAGRSTAEAPSQSTPNSALSSSPGFEVSAIETADAPVDTVQQVHSMSEPQMAITPKDLEMDPQASIDALLAQQTANPPPETVPEPPMQDASVNVGLDNPAEHAEAGLHMNGLPNDEDPNTGSVPPSHTPKPLDVPDAVEDNNHQPKRPPPQDTFSRAALTYALSPSHGGGHGEQKSGDESMDLLTIAGLAQWAHGVLQRYGKEYLSAILEISQLTGRITKETQEIIMAIAPLLESVATEKAIPAKQIVSMLLQLDAFLGTVSASDSRLLPFLLQDDMEVFPLIRP